MSDARAQQARQHHQDVARALREAESHRQLRDRLVRALRDEDVSRWSYSALAAAVGCSPELIAVIVKNRPR